MPITGGLTLTKDEKKFDNAIEVYGILGIKIRKQNENPNRFDHGDIDHCTVYEHHKVNFKI